MRISLFAEDRRGPVSPPDVSLVIPARNEAATIVPVIRRADAALARAGWSSEIIVVDSASTDGTGHRARAAGPQVRVIRESRPGKGRALTTGFSRSAGTVLAFLDADLDLAPEDLPAVVRPVLDGATCAAAMKTGAALARRPLSRRLGSRVVNLASALAFGTGLRDHQTGMKAFNGAALRQILPGMLEQGWLWDSEVLWRLARAGGTFVQVPVELSGSRHGQLCHWRSRAGAAMELGGLYVRALHEDRARRAAAGTRA
jgi:glycosyltransferase involved in cell wall biosynthesis